MLLLKYDVIVLILAISIRNITSEGGYMLVKKMERIVRQKKQISCHYFKFEFLLFLAPT